MQNVIKKVQPLRDQYIRSLAESDNKTQKAKQIADDLFALDLTVYSKDFSFCSSLYNAFAKSVLDENYSLHPEQLRIISQIEKKDASIISAPTSFGKTYCIFEYIAKHKPKNIVLVVPTLALVDEYRRKILKKYQSVFIDYKKYSSIDLDKEYDFDRPNVFILTHDRIVHESSFTRIEKIDFLVIDEVYKLETDIDNDRVLVLNMAYYHMAKKAKKYVLLAPFIGGIANIEHLENKPVFFRSDYSPVVNEIIENTILNEADRSLECKRILDNDIKDEKTLIYFPTVIGMYQYITSIIAKEDIVDYLGTDIEYFINWAKDEIHDEWCLITAMERGYLIHNGQIPVGTRMFQLNEYEKGGLYNRMLCTSTLLEGVNTTAKNIIITKPSRSPERNKHEFSAFDFYNLVGRTGRLNEHYIGTAYYLKGPNDQTFNKADAKRTIKFELVDSSLDMDIQRGLIDEHPEVLEFLKKLGITLDEYKTNIGIRLRFSTVLDLFDSYLKYKKELIEQLDRYLENDQLGRFDMVNVFYIICEGAQQSRLLSSIITGLLHKSQWPKIKKVVNETKKHIPTVDINELISHTIRLKNSYIEHTYYAKVSIIKFFMQRDKTMNEEYVEKVDDKILQPIEFQYFLHVKHKKMLLDLGIYDRDIKTIIDIIGDDFDDGSELRNRLIANKSKFRKKNISYISQFIINSL
ncbi:MAG: DEAD/DEAH box helicase [Sedimentisphaerales bacterium]|nr:DEAD/DEAH box helicase [Sedimentisphaerales bacterium]